MMKVRIDYEISDDLIRGEIGNALDHGIQYWCASVDAKEFPDGAEFLSDIPTMGGEVLLTDHDGDTHTLNLAKIRKGIRLMSRDCPDHFHDLIHQTGDCYTSDALIQFALFGRVVYC
jgi:hypothetical protein